MVEIIKEVDMDGTIMWFLNVDGFAGEKYEGARLIFEDLDSH